MVNGALVTREQMRAARAWLNWSQDELSAKSGVSRRSIAMYEAGRTLPYDETLEKLRHTFEAAGVRFLFVGMVGQGITFDSGGEEPS
ncbi:helix-turn-helix domain-containing protein [Tardiphaga sp. 619_E2_N8_4]|uniref:helix-turn-helix domain-containing protein n=2 Tax=Tardiphaga TaxID=1395974 RepID=UPI003F26A912